MKPCQPPEKKFKYGLVIGILVIGIFFGFRYSDFGFSEAYAASGTVLDFDGSDDYIVANDNAIFDQADRLSLSVWIEPDDTPTDDEYIVYRYNNYYIKMNTSKQIVAAVYGAAWATATSTAVTCDGATWTHIEMTYDKDAGGTDELKLYINGNLSAVADYSTAIPASTKKLYIGSGDEAGDNTPEKGFDGQIDDVRLYAYARSASDVRLDYNDGLAVHLGPTGKTCSEDPSGCMDYGLVGYWGMDEGSGLTAYDASGNSNNGTLTNGPKWTKGKQNGALQFDGTDDYVDLGTNSSLLSDTTGWSISLWVYYISQVRFFTFQTSSTMKSTAASNLWGTRIDGNATADWMTSPSIPTNTWSHLVYVFDGVNDVKKIYLNGIATTKTPTTHGAGSLDLGGCDMARLGMTYLETYYYNGTIDEVRIFNRALSAEEVRYHYNKGAPVAEWKFDEGVGDKAYDESPNNNDGLLGGGTAANKPTWVEGKSGSALSFDGSNDYVDCGNNASLNITDRITVAFWIKDAGLTDRIVISKGDFADDGWYIFSDYYNTDHVAVTISKPGGSQEIESSINLVLNEWTHIVVILDNIDLKVHFYKNGNFIETKNANWAWTGNINRLFTIGCYSDGGYNFKGTIDDVRIYNYARSADQIRMDYQQGLSTHLK